MFNYGREDPVKNRLYGKYICMCIYDLIYVRSGMCQKMYGKTSHTVPEQNSPKLRVMIEACICIGT